MIGVGLIGFGYWGPNLARNFSQQPDCKLLAISDINPRNAALATRFYPHLMITDQYEKILDNHEVQAILIATPVGTHYRLVRDALLADKDVLVEKPLCATVEEGKELVAIANKRNRILAVDHTFVYTGAVEKIKEIVDSGVLGQLLYIDSVRINLGLFQQDVNVVNDLAPHDLSIVCHLVGIQPEAVIAIGCRQDNCDFEYLSHIHMEFANGITAHLHLNWLSPVKIRRTLITGTNKMIVYDDMEPSEKVKLYDKGIVFRENDPDSIYKALVDYRTGDMVAPKLRHREALNVEAEHFLTCVRDRTRPLADGIAGLNVVRIIEGCQISLRNQGARIELRQHE